MVGNGTFARNTASSETRAPAGRERGGERRVIKRYSNRKLYDTEASRYVTLLQIADMVRAGEDVQVIDKVTHEDKTDVTLALIISEELRASPNGISLTTLRDLILRHGAGEGSRALPEQTEETVQKGEERMPESGERHATLGRWQEAVDERIRVVVPACTDFLDLRGAVESMAHRVAELEHALAEKRARDPE